MRHVIQALRFLAAIPGWVIGFPLGMFCAALFHGFFHGFDWFIGWPEEEEAGE